MMKYFLLFAFSLSLQAAQLTINRGAYVNDPSAESTYSAFGKVNTNFNYLFSSVVTNVYNVKYFGAKGDGVLGTNAWEIASGTDDTAAFRLASSTVTNGIIMIPPGIYKLSGTITNTPYQRWIGSSLGSSLIFNTSTNYTFYLPKQPLTVGFGEVTYGGLEYGNFSLYAKRGIKIQDKDEDVTTYNFLCGLRIYGLFLWGDWPTILAAESNTNMTDVEMFSQGIGIEINKAIGASVSDCRIERFGCGAYLRACDISYVNNNTFQLNSRHVYIQCDFYYGSGVKLHNCNLIAHMRPKGVLVNGINVGGLPWLIAQNDIRYNFFESARDHPPSLCTSNDIMTSIVGNRFGDFGTNTAPVMDLSPYYDLTVRDNSFPIVMRSHDYINVNSTFYNPVNPQFFGFISLMAPESNPFMDFLYHTNTTKMFIPNVYCEWSKPNLLSPYSPQAIRGNWITNGFPWEVDTFTNSFGVVKQEWSLRFNTNSAEYHILFQPYAANFAKTLRVGVRGRVDPTASASAYGYTTVYANYGSTNILIPAGQFLLHTNTLEHEWRYGTFTFPDNIVNYTNISVFADASKLHVSQISLEPADYLIGDGVYTNKNVTFTAGTRMKRMTPSLSSWSELICITNGTYGVTNGIWVTNTISGL